MKMCPRIHEDTLSVVLHPLKLHGENVLNRQLLKFCTAFLTGLVNVGRIFTLLGISPANHFCTYVTDR